MDSEQTHSTAPEASSRIAHLEAQVAAGQRVQLVLILALAAFIGRSAWLQHRSLEGIRVTSSRLQSDIANQRLIVEEFKKYAARHPGFVPVLKAKGIQMDSPAAPDSNPRP